MLLKTENKLSKRILMIGPSAKFLGGIASYIENLTEYLKKAGFEITLFDPLLFRKSYIPGRKSQFSFRNLINSARMFRSYSSILKRGNYSIVHINSSSYWGFYEKIFMGYLARRSGKNVIFHIHGGNFKNFFYKHKLKTYLEKTLSKFPVIIVPIEEFKEIINVNNICVVHNGITLPNKIIHRNYCKRRLVFLSISVLEERKRIDLLVSAASELLKKREDFEILIAGDGPERKRIIDMINNLHLGNFVRYLGVVKGVEKENLYNSSDVFISCSRAESFGLTTVEAMSHGLAIISTPVGIAKKIIKNGNNGFLFKIDDQEDLVSKMENILDNKSYLEEMAINNLEISKLFSWERISQDIIRIYLNLLGGKV